MAEAPQIGTMRPHAHPPSVPRQYRTLGADLQTYLLGQVVNREVASRLSTLPTLPTSPPSPAALVLHRQNVLPAGGEPNREMIFAIGVCRE
jgi:hypothetical protein